MHTELETVRCHSFCPFAFADNQAAVVSAMTSCLGVVKDAVEEMEHVRKPLSLKGTCSGGFIDSEYSELEGIHKDQVQLLALHRTTQTIPPYA